MIDFSQVCFGRVPHDPARVAAIRPHTMAAAAPAPLVLPRNIVWTPTLARNNTLPTCTVAGLMNSARMWTLTRHGFDLVWDDDALLRFFASVAGCDPTPDAMARVPGLVMLDVLEHAQRFGFRVTTDQVLVPEFSAIDARNVAALRDAIYGDGSAYIGVSLRERDEQVSAWRGDASTAGPVIGGHCIDLWRYPGTFTAATWGMDMEADEAWVLSRIDEAYAVQWTMLAA